ncbi:MAG: hypothetical protein Q8K65_05345 [Alphaproteobacteria bacterium]|nr:hypothetical protein [Alphaproteobacteria bacterium]
MRKYSFLAVFFTLLFSLSVTAAYACQPGCDCVNVLPVMQNAAEAKRLQDKMHSREVIKQNDNSVGMTCFDRALMLTGKLGGIFSDVSPGMALPIANLSVFGTSSFPDYGASTKLVKGLDAVVSPTMQGHVGNFTDSLSHALGATVAGYLNAFVMGALQPILNTITTQVANLGTYVTDINTYYNTLLTAMNLLGLAMPAAVMTAVATINIAWAAINGIISGAVAALTNLINGIVNTIVSMISNAIHGLMAAMTPDGECSRIAKLWGNGNMPDLGIFPDWRSLMGGAVERGTPYFTMYQMLSGAIPNTFGTPGTHLMQELMNATNSTIVTNALNDLLPGGALSGPGALPSWQTPPLIPITATVDDIISQM